jgi:hypothetical protein
MNRWLLLGSIALVACGGGGGLPDVVSDTGYQGTWRRGTERLQSTIAIVEVDGRYRFRWNKTTADGTWTVNCDWEGRCEEFVDGEKTSDYVFRVWVAEETGHLRVECTGTVHRPTAREVYSVEELIPRKQGLVLRAHTIGDAGSTYEVGAGPRRDFAKISDHVLEPPEGWSPPAG